MIVCVFFFKQKTAYEMRISDWSSDVCSSDLVAGVLQVEGDAPEPLCAPLAGQAQGAPAQLGVVEVRGDAAAGVGRQQQTIQADPAHAKIGRASCRDRVCQYV